MSEKIASNGRLINPHLHRSAIGRHRQIRPLQIIQIDLQILFPSLCLSVRIFSHLLPSNHLLISHQQLAAPSLARIYPQDISIDHYHKEPALVADIYRTAQVSVLNKDAAVSTNHSGFTRPILARGNMLFPTARADPDKTITDRQPSVYRSYRS